MKKKILVLYTSVGMGHKFIAQNMAYHLEQSGHTVLQHDILQVQEGVMTGFGIWMHSLVNRRYPFVWRWLYFSDLVNTIGTILRVPFAKANSENLLKIVNEFQPDLILSTQTTGSAATVALIQKKQFHGRFVIGFSDYHLHKLWLYEEADLYLANTEEQKTEMMELGVPREKIIVCGITLKPLPLVNAEELRFELQVPAGNKLLIFGSGSLGIGFEFSLLKDFLSFVNAENNLTTIVLCGKNADLKTKLEALALPNVKPLGFFDQPTRLYQIGDLLVTKPGGLTIAEALQAGIQILVTHTLPGQEEPNYDYLLERKLIHPKPEPFTAQNLFDTSMDLLSAPLESESAEAARITQRGQEGKVLITAVENLFHNV